MSTIKKSDIVEDKDIVEAFNDINEAIKAVSKSVIDSANDFAKLQASVKGVKGFDELYKAQKKYNDLQNDTIKSQKLLADLDTKKQKLSEATAKAQIADNNKIIKSEEAKATAIAKSLNDEAKLRESKAKALINERKAAEQLLIADRNLLKESERIAKQAEKAAKDLAKETSLYAQKSKALNDQRAAAKELAIQYGVTSKEFTKAAKEVAKLDAELKKIDSSLGQNQRNVGNYTKAWDLAKIGWAAAGTAIIAAGKYILDLNVKFQKASSSLRAITGATLQDMKFYEAAAKSMGEAFGIAGDEMLKSFERVGSIRPELLKLKESLVLVTKSAITLSQASGGILDLAGATEALGAGMNQFNLSAKDSDKIINALAAGSQAGSAEVSSLAESFKTVGAVANNANMSLEDTVAALEVLGEKSLYGAEAGTKLRGTILKLQEAGKGFASGKFNLKDALIETKAQLDAIANPIEKAAYLQKMFGIENQTAGIIMLQNIEKYDKFKTAVTDTNTAFEMQAVQMDNVAGSAAKFGVAMDNMVQSNWFKESLKWVIDFGTALIETGFGFKKYIQTVDEVISDVSGKFLAYANTLDTEGKIKELVKGIAIVNAEIAKGNNIEANTGLQLLYNQELTKTKLILKESNDILMLRWDLSSKSTAEILIQQEQLTKQSQILTTNIKNQSAGIGIYDVAMQDQLATTNLQIKAIDQEIAARNGVKDASVAENEIKKESIKLTKKEIEAQRLLAAEKMAMEEQMRNPKTMEGKGIIGRINVEESPELKAQREINKKVLEETIAFNKKKADAILANEQLIEDTKKQLATDAWATTKDLIDTMFLIEQNNYDKDAKRAEDKYSIQENALKKQLDNDKLTFESRAQIEGQLKAIEAKKAEELKIIENKKRESQRKQFIINKAIAVAEIAMTTAQSVMKTYANLGAPWAIPLAIAVGAIGAVQAGLVIGQPMPAFDKGTENAPNTPFLVGEKGAEFVERNGKTQLVTEPTVMSGMGGAKITSRVETQKILQANQKDRVWSSFNKGESLQNREQLEEQRETNRLLKKGKDIKIFVSGNVSGFAENGNATLRQTFKG